MITKTAIGNYLRKQPNGDVGMYRNGFKDGVAWVVGKVAAPAPQPAQSNQVLIDALKLCYEHCRVYHPEVETNNVGQAVRAALQSAQPVSANIQTKIVKDISAHEGGKQQSSPLPTTEPDARGCAYCNHTLFLGSKCKNCGRVAQPVAAQPLTDDEILSIAHRKATRYTHAVAPGQVTYGFTVTHLIDFVRAVEAEVAAHGIVAEKASGT